MNLQLFYKQLDRLSFPFLLIAIAIPLFSLPVRAESSSKLQTVTRPWQIAQVFTPPPNSKSPPSTVGGGTRSNCTSSEQPLTALTPGDYMPLTLQEKPTFFVFLPETIAKTGEFLLKDEDENEIYKETFNLPKGSGIFGFTPSPARSRRLKLNPEKQYHWFFILICEPNLDRENVAVDAWIQRTALSRKDERERRSLENSRPKNLAGLYRLYANNGIWHEALAVLAEMRYKNPQDPQVEEKWRQFWTSVKMEQFIEQKVVR